MERTCPRCGIRFDATGLAEDATCVDCQEVTGDYHTNVWLIAGGNLPEWVLKERLRQIRHYTIVKKMSARAIAKRLGIAENTVTRWRRKLTEPVPARDIHLRAMMWRDENAQPARGSHAKLPDRRRAELYMLMRLEGWSKQRIRREFGVHPETMRRITKEVEHGESNNSNPWPDVPDLWAQISGADDRIHVHELRRL